MVDKMDTSKKPGGTDEHRTSRFAPRFGIGVRFISFVVLAALLAGGIVGALTIKASRETLRQETLNASLVQADLTAQFAGKYITARQTNLTEFASNPTLRQAVLNNTPEQAQTLLSQYAQTQAGLTGASIFDANGIQRVFSAPGAATLGQSFLYRDYVQQTISTGQPYLGAPTLSASTNKATAPYGVAIVDDQGKVRGVVSIGISLAALSDALVKTGFGKDTDASIIDTRNSGFVVADIHPEELFTQVSGEDEAVRRLLAGERGAFETVSSIGEKSLTAFAPVPGLPWGVIIATPSDIAFSSVQTLTRNAILYIGLVVFFAAMIGVVLVLGVTRPLRRLVEGAEEIGRGNLGYEVSTPQKDEVGDLSRAFGAMAKNLKNTLVSRDELAEEVGERKRIEQTLCQSEQKYRNLFENAEVGMYRSRLDGSALLDVNQKLCDIFGHTREEMLANPATMRWADPDARTKMIDQMKGKGVVTDYEIDVVAKDGEIRTCLASMRLFPDEGCLEGSATDITERKVLERARDRSLEEVKEKNIELERFTYTVSHDLKSPLVTIKTFLGYLKLDVTGANPGRIEQDMQFMNGAADKMSKSLDELLEMSRIGRVVNPGVTVTFQELVRETLNLVAGRIEAQGVKVQVYDQPITLYGDRPRLVEIWQNLVENAVKFMGDQPSPRIDIGAERGDHETVFYVRDNGIGIDPKYQPKVFNLFEKLDAKSEGTGMGLAITRRIVELYKGRLWVESQGPGQGTCFRFTLPAALDDKGKGEMP